MLKILIVDDDEDIVETTKFSLEAVGYECVTAFNGSEGLRIALMEKPDLILLDVMMPSMDGTEVLKNIRESIKLKDTPVIILTGVAEKRAVTKFAGLGVSDYIVKPYDSTVLSEKVKNILGTVEKDLLMIERDNIIFFRMFAKDDESRIQNDLGKLFQEIYKLLGKEKENLY